jgi:iron complex outermembrane receptor protein
LHLNHVLNVTDVEIQQELSLSRHNLVWGTGYRLGKDSNIASPWIRLEPPTRTTHRTNMFIQDEIALAPGKLLLTLGSKVERNSYTGWEVQPSASLLWNRTSDDTLWFSASRAVRTPTRGERGVVFDALGFPGPGDSITIVQNVGRIEFVSERLQAYEAGYRRSITPRLSLDAAGFYNRYLGHVTFGEGQPYVRSVSPLTIVAPQFLRNGDNFHYHGAEVAAQWTPSQRNQLRLSYSWLGGTEDDPTSTFVTRGPSRQLHARWYWNLPWNLQWDSSYFFFDGYLTVPA